MKALLSATRWLGIGLAGLIAQTAFAARTVTVTPSANTFLAAGGELTFTVTLAYPGETLDALGFQIRQPTGWTYVANSHGGTNVPDARPAGNQALNLPFAFVEIPVNSASFTFRVKYPAGLTAGQTFTAISGSFSEVGGSPTPIPVPNITIDAPPTAPVITTPPASQTVALGTNVTFNVVATGGGLNYQWKRNGGDIADATNASLTINNASGANAGDYTVTVTNTIGSATSTPAATLSFTPVIANFTPASASQGTLVTINGAGFSGASAVTFGGIPASFTVVSNFQITATVPTYATNGPIQVTRATGAVLEASVPFTVVDGPRLVNLTQRTATLGGELSLLSNFTVEGSTPKDVLIRVLGPSLPVSVTDRITDPTLTLYRADGSVHSTNNDWNSSLAATINPVGAIPIAAGSKDAALVVALEPGTYAVRAGGNNGATGVAQIEVYETNATQRFAFAATLAKVSAGGTNTTSFVLDGAGSKTLLILARGNPGTMVVGAPNAPTKLSNPKLELKNGSGTTIASNNNFVLTSEWTQAMNHVGAPNGTSSNDAALIVTLPAGSYSLDVSSESPTGEGMVFTEIHVVDSFRPATIAPALLVPLSSQAVAIGGQVTFYAPVLSKPNVFFVWQKAATAGGPFTGIPDASTQRFDLSVTSAADFAFYRATMASSAFPTPIPTAPAQVDVIKTPQTITFPEIPAQTFALGGTLNLAAISSSSLAVSYTSSNPSIASVSASGVVTINDVGQVTITASQAGNVVYSAAPEVQRTLVINKATALITVSDLSAVYNNTAHPVGVTTTPGPLPVIVTYTPTGGSPSATPPTNAGTYAVAVTIDHPHYQGTKAETLVIAQATQTITFAAIPAKTYGDADFDLTATSDSGLPVTITMPTSTVASFNGTTVHLLASGQVTFTAAQAGNGNYQAATSVQQVLTVAKANATVVLTNLNHVYNGSVKGAGADTTPPGLQVAFTYTGTATSTTAPHLVGSYPVTGTIDDPRYQGSATGEVVITRAPQTVAFTSFPANGAAALDADPFSVAATATSGFAVTYSSTNPSVATVHATTGAVTLVGTGTTNLVASIGESANFQAALDATRQLTVSNASQSIDFAALAARPFVAAQTFTVTATAKGKAGTASNLQVDFVSSDPAVATVSASTLNGITGVSSATVSVVAAGTTNIVASQPGSPNFAAAPDVSRALVIERAAATVTLTPATLAQTYDGTPRVVTATTVPAGLTVAITYGSGASATATPPTAAGTYPVSAAIQEANYTGTATGSLVVAKANQTIAFTAVATKVRSSAPFELVATASSELTDITFTSSAPTVATVSGNVVTVRGRGTSTLTASQAGNANYNSATATQELLVRSDAPVISSIPSTTLRGVKGSPLLYGPIGINATATPYTFSITGTLPNGLAINPANGNISGTPTATASAVPVSIVVTNDSGSDSRAITITIDPAVPAFSGALIAANATVGTAYTGFAAPTLVDGNAGITFTATGLPTGLSVNPSTGAITGTPSVSGTFAVQLTATNSTGSVSALVSITVAMPANAPVYSGPTTPSGKVGVPFSFTPNFGPTGGSPTTFAAIASGLPAGVTFNNATGVFSGTPTQAGSFPITITATRMAITVSADVTITINPSDTAPVIGFPADKNPLSIRAGTAITAVQLTATPTSTFAATGLPTGLSLSAAGLLTGTTNAIGTFDAQVTATAASVTSTPATWRISVQPALIAPVISSTSVVLGQVGVSLTPLTLTAIPAVPAPTIVLVTAGLAPGISATLPAGLSLEGNVISGMPTSAAVGTTTVMLVASANGLTGPGQELTFNIAPSANVPVVNSNSSAIGTVGQSFTYEITATNGPITGYRLAPRATLPAGLALTGGTIFGVPSVVTTTPIVVDIIATNASGDSLPRALAITILAPPAAPVVANAGATITGRVGTAIATHRISASENPTAFAASGLPSGLVLASATGDITGTPLVSGTFVAQVSAGNAGGFGASAPLNITIAASTQAPVIGGTAPAAGRVNTAFSYAISASNSPTSYAFTGTLPSGLGINTSTGVIAGTPIESGLFSISVTATNDGGTSLAQTIAINILPALNAPAITSAASVIATVNVPFTYEIPATNVPATRPLVPPETLDAVNLPAGLFANPAMGRIEGTPTTVGVVLASLMGTNASGSGLARDLIIDVRPSPSAPVINSIIATNGQVKKPFSYQITTAGTATSYDISGAPAWLTVNSASGALSGEPTEPGVIQVTLVAANGAFASTPVMLTIDVAAADGAPIIVSSRATSGAVNGPLTYQIASNVPLPNAITYAAQGLPSGLALNAATGAITGSPLASGTFLVRLSARNGTLVSYPVVLTLTISPSFQIN